MRSGVFILICLLFETLVSQENKVEGSLFDARTNLPVNGASIEIEDSFHKTQSLADGYFSLENILAGTYVLKITKEGYLVKRLPFSITADQTVNFRSVFLEVDVQELQQENSISLAENDFADDIDEDDDNDGIADTDDLCQFVASQDNNNDYDHDQIGDLCDKGLPALCLRYDFINGDLDPGEGLSQGLLKLLAAVAPLLGLLGTVTGMIVTFQAITQSGGGDSRLMADGISQALVTTVLGLVVAIPLLFLHSLLASRSKGLIQVLEQQSAGLIALHLSGAPRRD